MRLPRAGSIWYDTDTLRTLFVLRLAYGIVIYQIAGTKEIRSITRNDFVAKCAWVRGNGGPVGFLGYEKYQQESQVIEV